MSDLDPFTEKLIKFRGYIIPPSWENERGGQ